MFAQIIGTLALLKNDERSLIKGIVINRFRGNRSLFDTGKEWIEKNTGIKVLGVIPWINELFPAEDSLDLVDRGNKNKYADTKIVIMKLPSISNFSDFDSLESEKIENLKWVDRISELGNPDAIIIPGSKQTFKDIEYLNKSLLTNALKNFSKNGGHIFGICGGLQILGEKLIDPIGVENNQPKSMKGLGLLPIETIYESKKKYFFEYKTFYNDDKNILESSSEIVFEKFGGILKFIKIYYNINQKVFFTSEVKGTCGIK